MASALSGEANPGACGFRVSLEPQWAWWEALGWAGHSLELSTEHFVSCLLKIDYVSNFLSGFPRSLSLRTVLKHKNTKRVSTRGEFKKKADFWGKGGGFMWQTDTAWTPLLCLRVLEKKKKQKPSNLRLAVSRGKSKT